MVESQISFEETIQNKLILNEALYILYISLDRLNSENMKLLKCILCHIVRTIKKNFTIEVYLDESIDVDVSFIQ